MNVVYWTGFSKRKNSTKVPTGAGTSKTCYLKDGTSVLNPTIKLDGHGYRNISYVQISDFGRYYYVKDVREVGPQTHVELTVDPAASHKASITGSQQFVERANISGMVNRPDPLNQPRNVVEHKQTALINLTTSDTLGNKIIDYNSNQGTPVSHYILGVSGKTGVKYWGLTVNPWTTPAVDELTPVLKAIFGSNWISTFTSQFFGYKDCILSLKRVPYTPGGTSGQQIYVGDEALTDPDTSASITGTRISELPQKRDSGLTLIGFPADDHLSIRSYPYYAPYTFATLTLPFVGVVSLDVSTFAGDGKIGLEVFLDQFTADIIYKVRNSSGAIIGTYYGNCGADMPISGQSFNAIGMASGALQMIGGFTMASMSGGAALPGAIAGMAQMFEGAKIHAQSNGSISSFIGSFIALTAVVDVYTNAPTNWNIANMAATQGIIVDEQRSLSGISGFVQCRNAHVSIDGYDSERTEIESMLNNGIFIE